MVRKLFKRKRSTPRTSTTRITRLDHAILGARFTLAAGIAVVAAVMSYQALADLSTRGHIAEQWEWVWPVIVDGPHLAGALAVVAAQRRREPAGWGWFLLLGATAASVCANVAAAPPDTLSRVVHGAVPVVGVIQVKDLCIGIRKHLDAVAASAPEPLPAVVPQPLPAVTSVPDADQPLPIPPKPATPPPSAPPLRSVPKNRNSKSGKTTAMDRYKTQARKWIAEEPGITGTEIGLRLGKTGRYGRNIVDAIKDDDRKAAASTSATA